MRAKEGYLECFKLNIMYLWIAVEVDAPLNPQTLVQTVEIRISSGELIFSLPFGADHCRTYPRVSNGAAYCGVSGYECADRHLSCFVCLNDVVLEHVSVLKDLLAHATAEAVCCWVLTAEA